MKRPHAKVALAFGNAVCLDLQEYAQLADRDMKFQNYMEIRGENLFRLNFVWKHALPAHGDRSIYMTSVLAGTMDLDFTEKTMTCRQRPLAKDVLLEACNTLGFLLEESVEGQNMNCEAFSVHVCNRGQVFLPCFRWPVCVFSES